MLDSKDLDYFNYGKVENEKFWRRLGGEPNLESKSILDFGCGHGSLCIHMAKKNVNSILGIDLNEKLIKFATRIPAFMYLTDFRENTLQDVITKLEPDLFSTVTGLTVKDFHLLVQLRVFNTEQMNQAVFAFRRYEDASLRYTGIESHEGLSHYGLFNTVVAIEE